MVFGECFNVFKWRMRQGYQLKMGRYEVGGLTREDNVSHLRKWESKLTEEIWKNSLPAWRAYWKFWDCSLKMKPEPKLVPLTPISSEVPVRLMQAGALPATPWIMVIPLEGKTPVQLWGGQLASPQRSPNLAKKNLPETSTAIIWNKIAGWSLELKRRNSFTLNYFEVHPHSFHSPLYMHSYSIIPKNISWLQGTFVSQ